MSYFLPKEEIIGTDEFRSCLYQKLFKLFADINNINKTEYFAEQFNIIQPKIDDLSDVTVTLINDGNNTLNINSKDDYLTVNQLQYLIILSVKTLYNFEKLDEQDVLFFVLNYMTDDDIIQEFHLYDEFTNESTYEELSDLYYLHFGITLYNSLHEVFVKFDTNIVCHDLVDIYTLTMSNKINYEHKVNSYLDSSEFKYLVLDLKSKLPLYANHKSLEYMTYNEIIDRDFHANYELLLSYGTLHNDVIKMIEKYTLKSLHNYLYSYEVGLIIAVNIFKYFGIYFTLKEYNK